MPLLERIGWTVLGGMGGGLIVTFGVWLWIGVDAWLHFRKDPKSASSVQLWIWSAQQLIQSAAFLRIFFLAASVCALATALGL